jgi:endonuclease/exonuclease/phosphatase family metal-dependent hydrolase
MIKIITYNLSWESMTGKKINWHLCNSTIKNNKKHFSVCQNNIKDIIDHNFDFILLQEASNIENIIQDSKYLNKLLFLDHKSGKERMITLWNSNKYNIQDKITGEFETGRPWQLLIFDNLSIINLHAPHCGKIKLLKYLKNILKTHYDLIKNKRLIMGGDFNHEINQSDNIKYKDIKLYFSNQKLKTCCSNKFIKNNFNVHFDHILDSLKPPINLFIPKNKYLASDHKPVIAYLDNNNLIGGDIDYKKKYIKYKLKYNNLITQLAI